MTVFPTPQQCTRSPDYRDKVRAIWADNVARRCKVVAVSLIPVALFLQIFLSVIWLRFFTGFCLILALWIVFSATNGSLKACLYRLRGN